MKYVDEYRDAGAVAALAHAIRERARRPWTLMEICGGQTHNILRSGIDRILPETIRLVHGPGCPVCVTPVEMINKAVDLALNRNAVLCSFGDMVRVPGTEKSLLDAKAGGADVRIVYSPLDAVKLAQSNPERQVVFFAVGFETTAPANAMAVYQASQLGVDNFSVLVAHVLVPPAMEAILSSPSCQVQGFLAPGHVCAIEGYRDYERIAAKYKVPVVVTGFEPVDILEGVLAVIGQLEDGRAEVENQYGRAVRRDGNMAARDVVSEVFEVRTRAWRGVGDIPNSGLGLRNEYSLYDAELRFALDTPAAPEPPECIAGLVLQGLKRPTECSAFGRTCTPERPLGAPMVSSEGACAAYYLYARA